MPHIFSRLFAINALGILVLVVYCPANAAAQDKTSETKIDFSSDIRPILADTCYKCHGPDEHERKADLRLDTQSGLLDDSDSIVPGDLDASELYARIVSNDEDELMPPHDSGRVLTAEQKDLVKTLD